MFEAMKPKVILFDLYRTLIDIWTDEGNPDVWSRLARFLRYRGLRVDADVLHQAFFSQANDSLARSDEAYAEVDVLGIFRSILGGLGPVPSDLFALEVTQLFRTLTIVHFELFNDVKPVLEALHGRLKLGLISDAQRAFLEAELEMTGLQSFWDVTIVSSDHGFHKPDPRLFHMALERLGVSTNEAIYVGDSPPRDIVGARNAGIPSVLLLRGPVGQHHEGTCNPNWIIHDLNELRIQLLP